MKKNNKKNRLLVIVLLLITAVALAAGYLIIHSAEKKKEEEKQASEEETDKSVVLTNYTLDEVSSFYYQNKGESVEIEKVNSIYYLRSDHDFPLDQSQAKTVANMFASIKSKRLLEKSRVNFSLYNLGNPDWIVKVRYSDGTEFSFAAGDYNANVDAYYINIFDTDAVYLLDPSYLDSLVFDTTKLFYTDDAVSFGKDDVRKIDVTYSASALAGEQNSSYKYSVSDSKWVKVLPDGTIADDTAGNAAHIAEQLAGISFGSWAGYSVDEDSELEKYGLLDTYATAVISYAESTETDSNGTSAEVAKDVTFTFGISDNTIYFMMSGSDIVYKLDTDSIDGIITADVIQPETADETSDETSEETSEETSDETLADTAA